MNDFTLHDQTTAPDDSMPLLAKSHSAFGMIPGLHAVMAEAVLSEEIGLRRAGWSRNLARCQNALLSATSRPAPRSSAWR